MPADEAPFHQPLAGLAALKAQMAPVEAPAPAPSSPSSPKKTPTLGPKLVLQKERKGHGGKTMTRIKGLTIRGVALENLAKALKKAMGCGAVVEGQEILIQGDQTERLATWLQNNGAGLVIIGN